MKKCVFNRATQIMTLNSYLNLRFVNILHNFRATPYTAAEMFSAAHSRQSEVLAYTERLFRQDRVDSFSDLKNYLISLRDVNAWKVGVFKFFHSYYCAHPSALSKLSLRHDSAEMEKIIDNIEINPALNDFYKECGHDFHLALKYSVSKVICDERRLGWMNTFCGKFMGLLDLGADTGIIAANLVIQLDLVEAAYGLGLINENERKELIDICGKRIAKMFGGWSKFLAGVLLSHLYELCLSTAEVRYLPKKAQELLDCYYLCCNNDISTYLPIVGWEMDDLHKLKEAIKPLVNAEKLDKLWASSDESELHNIKAMTGGFNFYRNKLFPLLEKCQVEQYFWEYGKFDEFIPICNGQEFKEYFEGLKLPLRPDELPLFIMKFNMFTNLGVWSFGAYHERAFTPWPEKISVEEGLPTNRDYGNMVLPFYIPELDCDISLQIPSVYKCDSNFLKMTPLEQASFLAKDIAGIKVFFTSLPKLIRD